MERLSIHAITFAAVSALLIFLWALTTGSPSELADVVADPARSRELDFWPVWVIAPWATAVVIHGGVVLSNALWGIGARKRRERRRKRLRKDLAETAELATGLVTDVIGAGRETGRRFRRRRRPTEAPATTAAGPRWVTVLFTDIVESTSLNEALGDAAWHEVLARHREMVRECVDANDGEEINTSGDGFLIRFDAVGPALRCAVTVMEDLGKARLDDDRLPHLRVGVHAGEAVEHDDGDLLGRVVNLASRITTAAEVDEILVTESVADHAPPGFHITDRGLRELKGVAQPRHVLSVEWG